MTGKRHTSAAPDRAPRARWLELGCLSLVVLGLVAGASRADDCCLAGQCHELDPALCEQLGGTPHPGLTGCNPDPCSSPELGACCDHGVCTETMRAQCVVFSGTFIAGIPCEPNPCDPVPCLAGSIAPLERLLAIKLRPDMTDVRMTWLPDTEANGYNAWFVLAKADIPHANSRPPTALSARGCFNRRPPLCIHVGEVPGSPGTIYFYNVLGVCDGVEAAL